MDLDDLCQFLADNGLNPGRVKMYVYDYSMNYSVTYIDLGPQYLSLSNATVAQGDTLQMEYRVLPARLADTLELAWTSSDENIATVDENGVVTGVSKGQCVITAKAESGLSASANLTVGDETLPPEQPEMPDNNAPVDYPSAEADPVIWDNSVAASPADELNDRLEADGFWYKITGENTVQLITNPNAANSYSAVSFVQTTVNGVRSGSVGKLSGTYELWNCRSQGGEQAALTYTFEVTNGKAKLVFADPEGNVETLVECSTGDGPIQGTVTLDLPEGKSRIKLAGAEDAAASWTLEIDRGTWSDS